MKGNANKDLANYTVYVNINHINEARIQTKKATELKLFVGVFSFTSLY